MAAGDAGWKWGTNGSFTITLASLASSTTRLVGVESSELNLSTLGPIIDLQISGTITTGTSPTASRQIEIWAIGTTDNTNYPAPFDGTGSAETIGSAEQKQSLCRRPLHVIGTNSTSDHAYSFSGLSLLECFGSVLPQKIVLFVTHDTGVNLNSTAGNHSLIYVPVYLNVAAS